MTSPEPSPLSSLPQYPQASLEAANAPHRPTDRSTNGFAVASLALAIVPVSPLSIVFGIIALVQIRDRGQRGRGLAIAGLSLTGLWIVGFVGLIIVAILNGPDRDDTGSRPVAQLRPGDCVNDVKDRSLVARMPAVPCSSPHDGEVFAVFELSGDLFPGTDEVARLAEDGCTDRFDEYVSDAQDVGVLDLFYLYPARSAWNSGDHRVTCFATDSAGPRTGSLRD